MIRRAEKNNTDNLEFEVSRRRTFAIISHPDAGKTTLKNYCSMRVPLTWPAPCVPARTKITPPLTGWNWSSSAAYP